MMYVCMHVCLEFGISAQVRYLIFTLSSKKYYLEGPFFITNHDVVIFFRSNISEMSVSEVQHNTSHSMEVAHDRVRSHSSEMNE